MYRLKEKIYIISGYKNACIYDLNNCYLYHINRELEEWINNLINNENELAIFDEEKKMMLELLLSNGILEESNCDKNDIIVSDNMEKISFAWIEITSKCNLRCVHCYEESSVECNEQMTWDDFNIVVKKLKKYGIKKIQIIGGEPLILGEDLKRWLALVVENFESVEVFTNGTLLNDEWVEFLKSNNIKVALSVYSYEGDEHDRVTGVKGSHKLTNATIRLLKEKGVKYRVCNVLMKDVNLGEKNTDLYTLSSEKDIVRMAGRANLRLLSEDLIRKKLIVKDTFSYKLNPQLFYKMLKHHNCFSGKVYISSNLEVYPCVMERRVSHGSLRDDELDYLLKPEITEMNKDCIEECKDCEYRYACFDCRANSLCDNAFSKPWYCTYNPYTGEWLDVEKFVANILYN